MAWQKLRYAPILLQLAFSGSLSSAEGDYTAGWLALLGNTGVGGWNSFDSGYII
ncbi:hypothetical protein EIKCOROL_00745 [Eikenella corrodens ATCC 23834]|uniref:Uncharacterized protein n=1 Tax=Eikenella corrodens ATCC 23834 TaxID=546274 RepID=C0DTR5_EIKCO|nr:hypothetical protein EIKCOROL_00745 [Eikenella corrodens ATCC 23834]